MIKYQAKIYKDGKSYSVKFPDLPGCFSMGDTLQEAKTMAQDALSLFLEEAKDPKWDVPNPKNRKGKGYYWIRPSPEVTIPLMLRQKRIESGFTQAKMAQKLGITIQQVQKLETPGKSNPTVKTLERISQALKVDLEIDLVA
jgi:antitoxin HicB